MFRFLLAASFLLSMPSYAQSTWNGSGTSDNWSDAANWNVAPANGDNLNFGGSLRLNNSNDALAAVGNLFFNLGSGAFVLGGNGLTVNGEIHNLANTDQTLNMNLSLAAGNRRFRANVSGVEIIANGNLSGPGLLEKSHAGNLRLNGSNSFSGGLRIYNGTVFMGSSTAVGTNNVLEMNNTNDGVLNLQGSSPTLGGLTSVSTDGGSIVTGTAAASLTLNVAGATSYTYSDQLTGGMALTKLGTGTQILSGNNSFSGGTIIGDSTNQSTNIIGAGNDNAFGTGTITTRGAGIAGVGTPRTIANNLVFDAGGGNSVYFSGTNLTFTGPVSLNGSNRGIVVDNTTELRGVIGNGGPAAGIVKSGTGTLITSAANTYSGQTTVNDGVLQLNAAPTATSLIDVNNGSSLYVFNGVTLDRDIELEGTGEAPSLAPSAFAIPASPAGWL